MTSTTVILFAALIFGGTERISTFVGTGELGYAGDGGPASEARLNMPFDVAYDSAGNLFLSDTFNHCIRRVDHETGRISTVAGSGKKGFGGDGGPATEAMLDEPYGIVLDSRGNLYFADRLNRRIRRVDATTGLISTIAGNGSDAFSGDGGPARDAGLVEPNGVEIDEKRGRLLIADVADHRIRSVELATGTIETFAGTGKGTFAGDGGPAGSASIFGARAVALAPDGNVYILERQGNRLRVVDPVTGVIKTVAGTGKKGYSGDGGPALAATFDGPKELVVAPDGRVLIVDTENQAIRSFDPVAGLITTIAGCGKRGGSGDGGPATEGELDRPHGVAVAPDGSVMIGDTGNHRIRRVESPRRD